MRLLVLGGSRFIGRRLVTELLSAGHRVTLFNRGRADDGHGPAVERLRGDRRSARDLSAALSEREFDAAYDFLSYNAADARLAVEALSGRVGHLIHISTCSVYWCTGDFPCPVREDDFGRHGDFAEQPGSIEYEYGYNKRKAEEVLFAAHREKGFPVTAIRLPNVGGEGDPTLRWASYAMRIADGRPLILPDGGFAPFRQVYVGDAARALAGLPSVPGSVGQAYNLAGGEILSVRVLVLAMAELLGREVETVEIPCAELRAMGLGTRFSPFTQRAGQVPAIEKAQRDLGWISTPFRQWLGPTVGWSLDPARAEAGRPDAYACRSEELEAIERYRSFTRSLQDDAPAGTSSGPPG